MRLTLRTLLAYLDDTLEPTEIKQIGQKVAESDAAQELIARIKQITRRRRLTTPPITGPGAANFDPNTVAEYLDNALPAEQLADVEKLCLESDVHLAEIATCHQILTLVLGEPALVPPTARERMYGLVRGRESLPFRRASTRSDRGTAAATGDDGGTGFGMGGWRWAVPAAGILLVLALMLALMQVLPSNKRDQRVVSNNPPEAPEVTTPTTAIEKPEGKPDAADNSKTGEPTGEKPEERPPVKPMPDEKPTPANPPVKSETTPGTPTLPPPTTPSTERREVGSYSAAARSEPTILVQRRNEQEPWRRLTAGSRISTTDTLVSLPGFLSELRLDSGVHLQMRGLLPEFVIKDLSFLMESAVVIHAAKEFDLDFTLQRGRVYISNFKENKPARVRIRFESEVWDLTMTEPGTEVVVEVIRQYSGDINWQEGEAPLTNAGLAFLKGGGGLRSEYREFADLKAPPGPAFFMWNNKGTGLQGPIPLDKALPIWDKTPPPTQQATEMTAALEELTKRMTEKKPVDVVLMETFQSGGSAQLRLLSIYCLGALDEVRKLIDVLGEEDSNRGPERFATIFVLQRWIARSAEQGKLLFDTNKRTGILTESRKYLSNEADTITKLLYGLSSADARDPGTYRVLADFLQSPKIAVRELAYMQLFFLGARIKYNPAMPEAERQKAVAEVNKMVDEHKLPAPAVPAGGAAPGSK